MSETSDEERAYANNLLGLAEIAWGVIANVGQGNWLTQTDEWREAAQRWRDAYHAALAADQRRLAEPRSWALPAEPGPEVTRLRMYDDEGPMDDTFDRDGTDWREQGSGSPWRWPHLLVSAHYVNARLVDATPTQTPEESAPAGTVDLMAELRSSLERAKAARNGAATTPEESA